MRLGVPTLLVTAMALLAPAATAFAAEKTAAAPAPPADATTILADFRTVLPSGFSFGTWQGRVLNSPNGIIVQGNKGADGKGGIGQNLDPRWDLSKVKYIELALGVGALNEVPEVTIALNDADDTQYTARIRINQVVPQQPVWFRVRLTDFSINESSGKKAASAIDWSRISQWQLQGDWTTAAPLHVVFIALRSRQ